MSDNKDWLKELENFIKRLKNQEGVEFTVEQDGYSRSDSLTIIDPESHVTIEIYEWGSNIFDIEFNIDTDWIEQEGVFMLSKYCPLPLTDIRHLENYFENPLVPTEIELEEFRLDKGLDYPITSEGLWRQS